MSDVAKILICDDSVLARSQMRNLIEQRGNVEIVEAKTGAEAIEKYKEEKYSDFSSLQAREIGYVLSKDYWGQGLMSEAVKIVTDYLFDIVDLDVIFVGHFVNNKRSERVIEKAGFQFLKNDIYQTAFGSIEQTKEYVKYNPKHTYLDYQRVK